MKHLIILLSLFAIGGITACKKDKKKQVTAPPVVNEEELITTFQITFTDVNGVLPTVTAVFRDIDGAGGSAPSVFDTIRLQQNAVYHASITLLNESVSPAQNITDEVQEEDHDHLFCFGPDGSLNLSILRTDTDGTYEVGIQSQWTTGSISAGNTVIRLKHQPGVKNGTCDPGDTDIELTFRTEIQ